MASTLKIDTITTVDGTGNITFSRPVTGNGGIGKILQCLSATKNDSFSMSSSSWTDITGLSVDITPSATSSKILILVSIGGSSTGGYTGTKILRGSTDLSLATGGSDVNGSIAFTYYHLGNTHTIQSGSLSYLDSPSSTSALTYKVQMINADGTTTYVNKTTSGSIHGTSSITVMEVGA